MQLVSGVRLRLTNIFCGKASNYLAILHEYGWVSYWSTETWQLATVFKLNNESKKIIFESSYRYLSSLSVDGQVEVWRMKGENPKFKWGLEFKSATQIETNSSTENQFFVLMSSKDQSVTDK